MKQRLKRLDQWIANCGYASRSEVKKMIKQERVLVDGKPSKDPSLRVEPERITVDNQSLDHPWGLFFMLNKPVGYSCSKSEKESPIVFELLPLLWNRRHPSINCIGRLDRDTSGLLLFTDITFLIHKLSSPKTGLRKVYEVRTDLPVSEEVVDIFSSGTLMLDGESKPCSPAKLEIIDKNFVKITIFEGRFHQVRRMFEKVGLKVISLHRTDFGDWSLGDLKEGEIKILECPVF